MNLVSAAAENKADELLMTCDGIFAERRWIALGLTAPAAAEAVVVDINFLAPVRSVVLNADVDDMFVRSFVLYKLFCLLDVLECKARR